MSRAYLIRHGRAEAGWNDSEDPGLDERGRAQAAALVERLAEIGPLPVVSSPMRRCQETVAPLAAAWGRTVRVEPGVTEIPSPVGVPMSARTGWLRTAMAGTWAALGPRYTSFRDGVEAAVRAQLAESSAVICSHFIAINAVLGAITGDDRVLLRRLDNTSVTIVELDDRGGLRVVAAGDEADTLIR